MGICNSTSKHDMVQDRKRASTSHDVARTRNTRNTSKSQAFPESHPDQPSAAVAISQDASRQRDTSSGEMDHYGQSYTNRRTQEYDILQNIVLNTQVNFIDVDQRPSSLDDEEQQIRLEHYAQKLSSQQAVSPAEATGGSTRGAAPSSQDSIAQSSPKPSDSIPPHTPNQRAEKALDVAGLRESGLLRLAQLSQHPAWTSQGVADPVSHAVKYLRPTEAIPQVDLEELQEFTSQVHQALGESFPNMARKIVVSFEELEAEITEK